MPQFLVFRDVIQDKNTSKFHRRTGLSLPLHIYQVLTALITALVAFVHFFVIIRISVFDNAVFYSVSSVLLSLVVIFFFVVTLIDPVDPSAAAAIHSGQKCRGRLYHFARGLVHHESCGRGLSGKRASELPAAPDIENQAVPAVPVVPRGSYHCNVCGFVDPLSKHCNVCNKCVTKFDHHCVWVNNCIGRANYASFICLLLFSLLFLLYHKLLIFYIILSFEDIPSAYGAFCKLVFDAPIALFKAVLHLSWIVALVPFLFLLYLFVFHVYLICTQQTTYSYYIKRMDELVGPARRSGGRGV